MRLLLLLALLLPLAAHAADDADAEADDVDWADTTSTAAPGDELRVLGGNEVDFDPLDVAGSATPEPLPPPSVSPLRLSGDALHLRREAVSLLADLAARYSPATLIGSQDGWLAPDVCATLLAGDSYQRHRDLTETGLLDPSGALCWIDRADDVTLTVRLAGRSLSAWYGRPGPGLATRSAAPPVRLHALRPAGALLGAIREGACDDTPVVAPEDCAELGRLLTEVDHLLALEPVHAP
jgi:hypothetical protein